MYIDIQVKVSYKSQYQDTPIGVLGNVKLWILKELLTGDSRHERN